MTVASLPMYDLATVTQATDQWWEGLARAFRLQGVPNVPDDLSRGSAVRDLWTSKDLVFSQTCGYPLINRLKEDVRLVAVPCYDAPGCHGSDYCSAIVVPEKLPARSLKDLRGGICAVNSRESHSGFNILRYMLAPIAQGRAFFGSVKISGHHRESLLMLARGEADIAAIDCVTYALITRYEPHVLETLRILCYSPRAPCLPFITSSGNPDDLVRKLRAGLDMAFDDPTLADCRKALMLSGMRTVPLAEYQRIADYETQAIALSYPDLE